MAAKRLAVRGFTLIELLIIVSTLGIIASIAIPSYIEAQKATEHPQAEAAPPRIRSDYQQGRIEVLCDTATGTQLYIVLGAEGGGITAVVGGCQ